MIILMYENFSNKIKLKLISKCILFLGSVIATQLLDVAIRVQAVRAFAVSEMTSLLESFPTTCQNDSMYEVLYAAAWIVGEFSKLVSSVDFALE